MKGDMKLVPAPLGGLVLGTGGVKDLLLVWVLVVVVVLLVTGAVVVVTLGEGMLAVALRVLVVESTVVVVSFIEAVVVSCRGDRGGT